MDLSRIALTPSSYSLVGLGEPTLNPQPRRTIRSLLPPNSRYVHLSLETWATIFELGNQMHNEDEISRAPYGATISINRDWRDFSRTQPKLWSNIRFISGGRDQNRNDDAALLSTFLARSKDVNLNVSFTLLHPIVGGCPPVLPSSDAIMHLVAHIPRCHTLSLAWDRSRDGNALLSQVRQAPFLTRLTIIGEDTHCPLHKVHTTFAPNLTHLKVQCLSVDWEPLATLSLIEFIGVGLSAFPVFIISLINGLNEAKQLRRLTLAFSGPDMLTLSNVGRRKLVLPNLETLSIAAEKPEEHWSGAHRIPVALSIFESPALDRLSIYGYATPDLTEHFHFPSVTQLDICDIADHLTSDTWVALSNGLPKMSDLGMNASIESLTNATYVCKGRLFPNLDTLTIKRMSGNEACAFATARFAATIMSGRGVIKERKYLKTIWVEFLTGLMVDHKVFLRNLGVDIESIAPGTLENDLDFD